MSEPKIISLNYKTNLIIFPLDYPDTPSLSPFNNFFTNAGIDNQNPDEQIKSWDDKYSKHKNECIEKYHKFNKIEENKKMIYSFRITNEPCSTLSELTLFRTDPRCECKSRINLKYAYLDCINFKNLYLNNINFQNAVFTNANFQNAIIKKVIFEAAMFLTSSPLKIPSAVFYGAELVDVDFKKANLKYADFTHSHLDRINFNKADLSYANLSYLHLDNGKFWKSILIHTNLSNTHMPNSDFNQANLTEANLSQANLQKSSFWQANLERAYIWWANLQHSDFFRATLQETQFWCTDISYSMFGMANMDGASFQFSNLSNSEFWAVKLKNANLTKTILNNAYFGNAQPLNNICYDVTYVDSRASNKSFSDLSGARLDDAEMQSVNMENIILKNARMLRVNLDGANLRRANLKHATLSYASLKNVNLNSSNLNDTDFSHAILTGASLEDVSMYHTKFNLANVDGGTVISASSSDSLVQDGYTIDEKTDFSGVNLAAARISPKLRVLLERNIRELHWREWYKQEKIISFPSSMIYQIKKIFHLPAKKPKKSIPYKQWKNKPIYVIANNIINLPVRYFWKVSNYGGCTWTILVWFLSINFLFCIIYIILESILQISVLSTDTNNPLFWFFESYLSTIMFVVTFNVEKVNFLISSIMLSQKVLIYFILAALATRFGVMFRHLSP